LGDRVEAGCLIVIDESDRMLTIELPQFEGAANAIYTIKNNDDVMDIALLDQIRQNTEWLTAVPELQVLDSKPYDQVYFD